MWRENYRRKRITPGHLHNASTSLISPIRTLTGGCAFIEMSLQHPRSALRIFLFFYFFCAWTEVLRRDFTRIESLSALSRPTQTNNLCSLELSSGLTEESVYCCRCCWSTRTVNDPSPKAAPHPGINQAQRPLVHYAEKTGKP